MPIPTDPSYPDDEPSMPPAPDPASLDGLLLRLAGRLADLPTDPGERIEGVLRDLQQALQVDCVGLSLLPSGSDDLRKAHHYHAALGPCPARELLVTLPDLEAHLRRGQTVVYPPAGGRLPSTLAAAGIGTVLLLPIHAGKQWRGALGLVSRIDNHGWDAGQIDALQAFAAAAAGLILAAGDRAETGGYAWLPSALEASGIVDAGVWDLATGEFSTTINIANRILGKAYKPASNFTDYIKLVHPDHVERLLGAIEDAINSESGICVVEHVLLQPNGVRLWVEFRGRVRRDAAGRPREVEGTLLDISAHKQVEQALSEQRQVLLRQTRLMEQTEQIAAIGGWEWDLARDTLYFSPQMYRIYGFDPDQPLPPVETVITMCTPESEAMLRAAIQRIRETGVGYDLRLEITNTQGQRVPVRTTGRVERENGLAVRIYGVLQDMTQTANLERQLREMRVTYRPHD